METNGKPVAVMNIEIGVTRQPAPYQSVRCGVNLPVFVEPGEDVQTILKTHIEMAMDTVRRQVDDEFEQGHGEPAPYSRERRFVALVAKPARKVVILPQEMVDSLPGEWYSNTSKEYRGHRLNYILVQIARDYTSYELINCVDGDFFKLPPLQELVRWSYRPGEDEPRLQVLAKPGMKEKFNNNLWPGWWSSDTLFREYGEALLSECEARAAKEGATFIDCVDGDFSKLPAVPVKPEPEEEEIPFEDDDDTEDDDGHGDDED